MIDHDADFARGVRRLPGAWAEIEEEPPSLLTSAAWTCKGQLTATGVLDTRLGLWS